MTERANLRPLRVAPPSLRQPSQPIDGARVERLLQLLGNVSVAAIDRRENR